MLDRESDTGVFPLHGTDELTQRRRNLIMSERTGLKTVLLTAIGLGLSTGAAIGADTSPQLAQACTEGGYMLVMGGIEDPTTVPDAELAQSYGPAVWRLIENYDAFYVLRGTPEVVYEGEWPAWKAAVISKWPCRETGLEFWNSDAYQKDVKPRRKDAGVYDVGMFNPANATPPAAEQDLVPESCTTPFMALILSNVTDAAAYGQYGKALGETGLATRAGLQLLFSGQPMEVLEGTWPEGVNALIMVYPCRAAWEAFYLSEQYVADIKPLRANAGDFTIVGFTPERVE